MDIIIAILLAVIALEIGWIRTRLDRLVKMSSKKGSRSSTQ